MRSSRTSNQTPKPGYLAVSAHAAGGRKVFGVHMELSTVGVVSAVLVAVVAAILAWLHAH
jgi:hypothetical protein